MRIFEAVGLMPSRPGLVYLTGSDLNKGIVVVIVSASLKQDFACTGCTENFSVQMCTKSSSAKLRGALRSFSEQSCLFSKGMMLTYIRRKKGFVYFTFS